MTAQAQNRVYLVRGNTQSFIIPLEQEIISEGTITTVAYFPEEDAEITVLLHNQYNNRQYEYKPKVDGNLLIITDNGRLPVGCYGVAVTVKNSDGTRRHSNWNEQVVVTASNDSVLREWDEFKSLDVKARAALFFFAKGDKGDPGTTDYNELKNKPTIPTALADLSDDATHRLVTDEDKTAWNDKYTKPNTGIPKTDFEHFVQQQIDSVPSILQYIDAIAAIVPEQASPENQLADKDFVNSSVSTATADFKGTYNSLEDLEQVTANANDYAFVIANDAAGNTVYKRYKWVEGTGWTWEYDLNNSSFTAAQWAAINSTITNNDVTKLSALPTKAQLDALLAQKQDTLTSGTNIKTINGESVLGGGNITIEDKAFIAIYGETPYAKVEEAFLAGKFIVAMYNYSATGSDYSNIFILTDSFLNPDGGLRGTYTFIFTRNTGNSGYPRREQFTLEARDDYSYSSIETSSLQTFIQDLSTIRSGAAKGATAYQKPSTGIPASDIAQGVIPDVSDFITRTVNDLTNYYLKSETYTKAEVQGLISAIQQFHYEIYASLQDITTPASNVLYLIGPSGSGNDRYEEYVYANNDFTKIGDTSIDLSGYVTTQALNTALANYVTSTDLATLLSGKQDKIDATHKLNADLVDDSNSNNKFVTITFRQF